MVGQKIRKMAVILFLLTLTLPLVSCCKNFVNVEEVSTDLSQRILDCLSNDDKESLKEMFSDNARQRKELDDEIEQAMEFFDGKVIDNTWGVSSPDELAVDNHEIVRHIIDFDIYSVKTDTSRTYAIYCAYYHIHKERPDKVGISEIDIYEVLNEEDNDLSDSKMVSIGKYE